MKSLSVISELKNFVQLLYFYVTYDVGCILLPPSTRVDGEGYVIVIVCLCVCDVCQQNYYESNQPISL